MPKLRLVFQFLVELLIKVTMFTKYIHISKSKGVPYVQFKEPQTKTDKGGEEGRWQKVNKRMEKAVRSRGTSSEKRVNLGAVAPTVHCSGALPNSTAVETEVAAKSSTWNQDRAVQYGRHSHWEHPLEVAISAKDEPNFEDPEWEMSCQMSFLLWRQGLTM